jgi:excisionase family DNA binding protein
MQEDVRKTMTIEEAGAVLGVSRTTAYKLPQIEGFPVLRVGRRILVPRKAFYDWMESAGQKA